MTPCNPSDEHNCELDEILATFVEQCPHPTPAQVAEWQKHYPQYSREISELADGLLMLLSEHEGQPFPEPTPEELEEEYQKTLKLLREIEHRVQNDKDRN
jgi:isopenicillin N synthase-like dioxygenase